MNNNILKQYQDKDQLEVGLDEAGRGCLFGPVCIAGVSWLDKDPEPCIEIKDSKKCTVKHRLKCYDYIIDNAVAYSIQLIDNNSSNNCVELIKRDREVLKKRTQQIIFNKNNIHNIIAERKREMHKKDKTNILYLVGNLEFVGNPVALKNIDNDIYKIVQIDENIELWIKVHPRYEKNVLPIHSRVRFFFNDTDTTLIFTLSLQDDLPM